MIDYSTVVDLVVEVFNNALPIAIIFILAERLVQFFIHLAFPKMFR